MKTVYKLLTAILVAALLWFYMFCPWTAAWPNFWLVMCVAAVALTALTLAFTPDRKELLKVEKPLLQLAGGVAIAFALWGIIYRLCPKALPALILSHALWDALVFVILPI